MVGSKHCQREAGDGQKTKGTRHVLFLHLLLLKSINGPSKQPNKPLLPSNSSTFTTIKPCLPPAPLTSSTIRLDLLLRLETPPVAASPTVGSYSHPHQPHWGNRLPLGNLQHWGSRDIIEGVPGATRVTISERQSRESQANIIPAGVHYKVSKPNRDKLKSNSQCEGFVLE